jgi:hypothetical protein
MKKIYSLFFITLTSLSTVTNAHSEAVRYHCPSIKEASDMFTIKTSLNKKNVEWLLKSNILRIEDRPVHFTKVTLIPKEQESFDMEVFCEYRTNTNKKFIVTPMKSWSFYVDGIAKEPIGDNWHSLASGEYSCTKSILDCLFLLS